MPLSCVSCGAAISDDAVSCRACGAPVATVPVGAQPRPERYARGAVAAIVISAIVTVAALGGIGFVLFPRSSGGDVTVVSAAAPAVERAEIEPDDAWIEDEVDPWPEASPSAEATVEWIEEPEPAPAYEIETVEFESPSGNLRCRVQDQGWGVAELVCQQAKINYDMPWEACDAGAAGVVVGLPADGAPYWPCLGTDIEPDEVLDLDTVLYYEGISCEFTLEWGASCWNDAGYGFQMEFTAGVELWQ